MVRCYVNMFGGDLWICLEDGMLLTSAQKEDGTVFTSVEECNERIKGTELREVDGYEEVYDN